MSDYYFFEKDDAGIHIAFCTECKCEIPCNFTEEGITKACCKKAFRDWRNHADLSNRHHSGL